MKSTNRSIAYGEGESTDLMKTHYNKQEASQMPTLPQIPGDLFSTTQNVNLFQSVNEKRNPALPGGDSKLSESIDIRKPITINNSNMIKNNVDKINEQERERYENIAEKIIACVNSGTEKDYLLIIQRLSRFSVNQLKILNEVMQSNHSVQLSHLIEQIPPPMGPTIMALVTEEPLLLARNIADALRSQDVERLANFIFLYSNEMFTKVLQKFQQEEQVSLFNAMINTFQNPNVAQMLLIKYVQASSGLTPIMPIADERMVAEEIINSMSNRNADQFVNLLIAIPSEQYMNVMIQFESECGINLVQAAQRSLDPVTAFVIELFHEHKMDAPRAMAFALSSALSSGDMDRAVLIAILVRGAKGLVESYRIYGDLLEICHVNMILHVILQLNKQH